jgi:rubrerythrin
MSIRRSVIVAMLAVLVFSFGAIAGTFNIGAQEKETVSKTTLDNLMTAYSGENNAHVRYLAFAKQAEKEGYGMVAALFRAAALAEQFHYERDAELIKKLGGTPKANMETPVVKTTKENLESAIKGESYENTVMYTEFVKQAKKDNNTDAVDLFEDSAAAEGAHAKLYESSLKNLALSKNLTRDFYVCPTCGNIVDALTRTICEICGTSVKKFKRVK